MFRALEINEYFGVPPLFRDVLSPTFCEDCCINIAMAKVFDTSLVICVIGKWPFTLTAMSQQQTYLYNMILAQIIMNKQRYQNG